jgi:AraC-like DNA-binding protein
MVSVMVELAVDRARPCPGVELRRWQRRGHGARVFPTVAHDELELSWIERGAARFRIGSRSEVVERGRLFLVPPGVEHETAFLGDTSGVAIGLDAALLDERVALLREGHPLSIAALSLARLFDTEHADLETLVDALAIELLAPRDASPQVRDRRVASIVARIHDELADDLSVGRLAADAGLSRFHFARLFRAHTGKSPRDYVLEVRLAEAARRLARRRESVSEVALAVGFTDLPRFARQFRRSYGTLPSRWREAGGPPR